MLSGQPAPEARAERGVFCVQYANRHGICATRAFRDIWECPPVCLRVHVCTRACMHARVHVCECPCAQELRVCECACSQVCERADARSRARIDWVNSELALGMCICIPQLHLRSKLHVDMHHSPCMAIGAQDHLVISSAKGKRSSGQDAWFLPWEEGRQKQRCVGQRKRS